MSNSHEKACLEADKVVGMSRRQAMGSVDRKQSHRAARLGHLITLAPGDVIRGGSFASRDVSPRGHTRSTTMMDLPEGTFCG
jgi:hypothetical protein